MPDVVKIGPLDYTVTDDAEAHLGAEDEMSQRLYGMSDKSTQRIVIRPGMAAGFKRQIVLHEIVHQLLDDSGLELATEIEEQICLSLQAPLLGLLKDNPDLVAWLTSEG
jgi:hypothetical protein